MTREEALSKAIMTHIYFQEHFCKSKEAVDNTQAIIDTLEQIEQEPKWIPVSKRLPEENMFCLVSVGKLYLTQTAIYSDLMGTIGHRIFYQGDYGYETFVDITQYVNAWMPLPEPYKGESEDKE